MILVDPLQVYSATRTRGLPSTRWCHMVSDVGPDELHAFAARIGLQRSWAQANPAHYDLTPRRRARAIELGATSVTSRELVRRNYDGQTRRRERSGRADPIDPETDPETPS